MSIESARLAAKKAEGLLTEKEGELLYMLARGCKGQGEIVEIGSWKGRSTIWLAFGSKHGCNVKVHAIDPHTGSPELRVGGEPVWTFDEFSENIRRASVDDLVISYVSTSDQVAGSFDLPIELIFIDGAHDYESVKSDFDLWFPKVLNNGIMAFHDTTRCEGPKKVVSNYVFRSRSFAEVKFSQNITYARKVGRNSLRDCVRNRVVLMLKNAYDLCYRLNWPSPIRSIGRLILKKFC